MARAATRGRGGVRPRKTDLLDDLVAVFSRLPVAVPIGVAGVAWAAAAIWMRPIPVLGPIAALLILIAGLLTRSRTLDGISRFSWRQFEDLLAELFRKEGYRVEPTANGADGGIDHILRGHGETVFVQARHWNARRVSLAVVQRTYGIAVAGRASRAMVVTSGTFTPDAIAFAGDDTAGLVELVDGVQLLSRLQAHGLADAELRLPTAKAGALPTPTDQACLTCGAEMRIRRGRHGRFLGCSRYPSCRGTRALTPLCTPRAAGARRISA